MSDGYEVEHETDYETDNVSSMDGDIEAMWEKEGSQEVKGNNKCSSHRE